jgi:thiazole synthase
MSTDIEHRQLPGRFDRVANDASDGDPFFIGGHVLLSRLILGTGKFNSFETMRESISASGAQCVTVAVRREKLHDSGGRNILDYLDPSLLLLPNTSGCFDAESAVRCARMGREILKGLLNPAQDWVKLEVLGDSRSLLPDPVETLRATEKLVQEGFQVLCYSSDDPIIAKRLQDAGAASVMPAASPIGSGLGIANRYNLQIILEDLKRHDPKFPVIVDAGIGTASDAAAAMELGVDGVLLNTSVARAKDPVMMALAMKHGVEGGRLAYLGGRIEKTLFGSASSPEHGYFAERTVRDM